MTLTRNYFPAYIVCLALCIVPSALFAATSDDLEQRQEELEDKLADTLKEINSLQVFYNQKSQERQSLERDVELLDTEIQKSKLSIQARNINIGKIGGTINEKAGTIVSLSEKMQRQKSSLAQLIRQMNEIDDYTLVEVALSNQNVSDFFEDLDSFDSVGASLQGSFREIEDTKTQTAQEKRALEERQIEEVELRKLQELEKQKIEVQEDQKQEVLTVTRGQEGLYQNLITQKQQTAAEIRAELFRLRGSTAISFGEALDFAVLASAKTGVRAAVILGTLQQETKLGDFLGNGTWQVDSHPERDRWIFPLLMNDLGINPDSMPVSKAPSYGYGGAMGPAQFIPSTWVLYAGYSCNKVANTCTYDQNKDRIGSLTGNTPPNPYNPADAFMAAALLLKDNGADRGTFDAERLASLRYFAGWGNAGKPSYAFYGDEVMRFATGYQQQIDILGKE